MDDEGIYRIEIVAFIISVAYFVTRFKIQIERVSTQDVGVSSAFLVELFHLEYSGPFLVGHSFLVGLVVGLFGWLLAWGLWRFWRVFPYKRLVKI